MSTGIVTGRDGVHRCWWGAEPEVYQDYHDQEWGRPVVDDIRLFEELCLEGFQCGLSWLTILRKREHFRHAFLGFDFLPPAPPTMKRINYIFIDYENVQPTDLSRVEGMIPLRVERTIDNGTSRFRHDAQSMKTRPDQDHAHLLRPWRAVL